MVQPQVNLKDVHRLMDILQNIDVGLVVIDREYKVQLWNSFMESHSGLSPQRVQGTTLYSLFPDIDEHWLKLKTAPVFELRSRAFTQWQQRPYLFRFRNVRPITGRTALMYQNVSFIPLEDANQKVNHVCLVVYDVTDQAVNQRDIEQLQQALQQPD